MQSKEQQTKSPNRYALVNIYHNYAVTSKRITPNLKDKSSATFS